MGKIKTVFFCGHQSPYGLAHCEPLLKSEFDIVAVVLATDKRWNFFKEKLTGKVICSNKFTFQKVKSALKKVVLGALPLIKRETSTKTTDVENIAKEYQVPIIYADDVNSQVFIRKLQEIQPDLVLSAAYPQIFSKEFISIAKKGSINFHPSLLPKFRGAHPHFWTIVKGETESGLTAHFMTERIDDGDIISQIKYSIQDFTYEDLYKKMIEETPNLIAKVQAFIIDGVGSPWKQNETEMTYFKNDREIHHRIHWDSQDVKEIYNLVRTGAAFCFFRNKRSAIINCTFLEGNRSDGNGLIVNFSEDSVVVSAKNGLINIQNVIYNRQEMSALDFIEKFRIKKGEKFE